MMEPLTAESIVELHNDEILGIIRRVSEFMHSHVKKPCYELLECETGLFRFMCYLYDSLTKKFTNEEIREDIQSFFASIELSLLGFYSQKDYSRLLTCTCGRGKSDDTRTEGDESIANPCGLQ